MNQSRYDLIGEIIKNMRCADLWNTGEKNKDDITTLDFEYLGKDEELLKKKPKITLTTKWDDNGIPNK